MKTVYLDAPGGAGTWRTRRALIDNQTSSTHTDNKIKALKILRSTRKRTSWRQGPAIGQLTKWQPIVTAVKVMFA